MAVYTVLDRATLDRFVAGYGQGSLRAWQGAAEGVENTTYFLTLENRGRSFECVLTLFEGLTPGMVDTYAHFTAALALAGLPVPSPLVDASGRRSSLLADKPAVLVPRVPGRHPVRPSTRACRQIGEFLAHAHRHASLADWDWPGPRSLVWLRGIAEGLLPQLSAADRALMVEELGHWSGWEPRSSTLPQAVVHGDLFRDNCLYHRGCLRGVIDFFSAGTGYLLFDLAVVVNDWCSDSRGRLIGGRYFSIVSAYKCIRPWTLEEEALWPSMLRLAALRFWASRLAGALAEPETNALIPARDPMQYRRILVARREWPLTFR